MRSRRLTADGEELSLADWRLNRQPSAAVGIAQRCPPARSCGAAHYLGTAECTPPPSDGDVAELTRCQVGRPPICLGGLSHAGLTRLFSSAFLLVLSDAVDPSPWS